MEYIGAFLKNIIAAFFVKESKELTWPETTKAEKPMLSTLAPGEADVVKALDAKTSKLAFETVLRWVYIDRTETLNTEGTRGVTAWARQFVDEALNSFRPNLATFSFIARQPFKKRKMYIKKRRIYDAYRFRRMPAKVAILNTEELATVYHFPTITVKVPIPRVEAKKGSPPPGLPIQ